MSPEGPVITAHEATQRPHDGEPVRVTFVIEQQVGLKTFGDNLRRFIEADPGIRSTWQPITYERGSMRHLERVGVPSSVVGALAGRRQVCAALDVAPVDVRFFLTQVPAALGGRRVRNHPYVLMTDITPVQYDTMANAYGQRADSRGLLKEVKHLVNRRVFAGAAFVYATSSWVLDSLARDYGVDRERAAVLAPGVDLERWCPRPRSDDGPLRVLFVGSDFVRKGGPAVLATCAALGPELVQLHVVTRSDIDAPPDVIVHRELQPNSSALIELFQRSDVLVMPSVAEAFGQVVVEASGAGLAAVVADVGGMPGIIEHGRTGFVVPPRDLAALRQRLEQLARDRALARSMGAAARQRATELFDARANGRTVGAKLREVAAAPTRPRGSARSKRRVP